MVIVELTDLVFKPSVKTTEGEGIGGIGYLTSEHPETNIPGAIPYEKGKRSLKSVQ